MVAAVACIAVSIAYQLGFSLITRGEASVTSQANSWFVIACLALAGTGLHRTVDLDPRGAVHAGHAGRGHLRRHRRRPTDAAGGRPLRAGADRGDRVGPGPTGRGVRRLDGHLRVDDRRRQLHLRPHRRFAHRADQLHPGPRLPERVLRRGRDRRGAPHGGHLRRDLLEGSPLRRQHPARRTGGRVQPQRLARALHPRRRLARSRRPDCADLARHPAVATALATNTVSLDPRYGVLPVGYTSDGELVMVIERSLPDGPVDSRTGEEVGHAGRARSSGSPAGPTS